MGTKRGLRSRSGATEAGGCGIPARRFGGESRRRYHAGAKKRSLVRSTRLKIGIVRSFLKSVRLRDELCALNEETRYRILKLLEENPALSQRGLARELGVSVGKVNYCLRSLIDKGWLKVDNFRRQENKSVYMYLLTPRGLSEKARITVDFLRRKEAEYEVLVRELDELRREVSASGPVEGRGDARAGRWS